MSAVFETNRRTTARSNGGGVRTRSGAAMRANQEGKGSGGLTSW